MSPIKKFLLSIALGAPINIGMRFLSDTFDSGFWAGFCALGICVVLDRIYPTPKP